MPRKPRAERNYAIRPMLLGPLLSAKKPPAGWEREEIALKRLKAKAI